MATATRTPAPPPPPARTGSAPRPRRPRTALGRLWQSTIGKKTVMAVSGAIMLLYLIAHMVGNLEVFFGPDDMNHYAHWLRTIGQPVLRHGWFLWIMRPVLLAAVILHIVAAAQLSRRDLAARPVKYVHRRRQTSYATRTMRWGGVIIALFVIWHILDLTTGTVNPNGESGRPYQNIVATFDTWYGNVIYITAMIAVGLHIRHGFYAAAQTLGAGSPTRNGVLKATANGLALVLTVGFLSVPFGVMTGIVE
ncbi:succinate dehydrogenase cytochrome b subunit [Streptomyces sp. DSM 44917]|uniref:Succinate dehydrogenase cytochrome b subunit n=1 Tax=Streptomyces boetiae TaxID=3075541 RepID=A0ABU2LDF8_9ACTN|nr:succinate dehydrogenase cytochrome b subunit [Streptomyces sp. DSM 44917]MDT0309218.1 succinate dehydrogenase cytochrome b subunit [Streptomyces sp. DSM 44917]